MYVYEKEEAMVGEVMSSSMSMWEDEKNIVVFILTDTSVYVQHSPHNRKEIHGPNKQELHQLRRTY